MDLLTVSNIILSILSFVLAALSLVFVYLTLKQNNKLLYANSRPYLSIYFAYEENNSELFICVKNCGNSSAIIHELELDPDITIMSLSIQNIMKGSMLAPGQQVHFLIPQKKKIMDGNSYDYRIRTRYSGINTPRIQLTEEYNFNVSYIIEVLHSEHKKSNLSSVENSLWNLEKDVKAIALQKL